MYKVVCIPGNGGGSVFDGWFPSLLKEMNLPCTIELRNFPDAVIARESYWIPYIHDQLNAREETILIGHSTGAIAAMRYAETYRIAGSMLVAAYYTDLGDENEQKSEYFNRPWHWEKIRENQQWIVQFASTDDPFIPIKEARYVHEKLRSEYYEFTDQGHFGYPVEKKEFPELIRVLRQKLIQA